MSSKRLRDISSSHPSGKLLRVTTIHRKNYLLGRACFFILVSLHSHLVTSQKLKPSVWCRGHLCGDFNWRETTPLLFYAGSEKTLSRFQPGDAKQHLINMYFQRCFRTYYCNLCNCLCNLGLLMRSIPICFLN